MFQGTSPPSKKQAEWSIHRHLLQEHSGLVINSEPLLCVHTHWVSTGPIVDPIVAQFNDFVVSKLKLVRKQSKVQNLLNLLAEKRRV